jgi:PAS domain S-box-containing protein
MKLLYVEDEPAHFILTQRTLEDNFKEKFLLFHAESMGEAFKVIDAQPDLDLILTDLRLPDGSGLDLLRQVNQRHRPVPVILVTGQGDEENAVAALKAGAADYLVKQSDYLLRLPVAISNAVAHNRLLREQAALREAEVKYQSLVEQIPAVVFLDLADKDNTPVYMSPRIETLSGYPVTQWLSDLGLWERIIHPDDAKRIRESFLQSHGNHIPFSEEYRLIHRAGRIVWVKENTNLIRDTNGSPLYWQGILLDITRERESQAAFRESEERFRRVFHSSPIATCVVTLEAGKFIDANASFLELAGLQFDELIGQTSLELGFWDQPGSRALFVEELKSKGASHGIEIRFSKNPDEPRDTLAYYELIELGGDPCVLAMFYDVTEQKKSQNALQRERDFALQVLNTMGQGLTVTGNNGLLDYVNPAFAYMVGYSQKEMIGREPSEFLADSSQAVHQKQRMQRQEGKAYTYESALLHKDSREVPVIITSVPRWQNDQASGSIAVITDLTAIKRAEESLARQVKELSILHSVAIAGAESRSETETIDKTIEIISQIYTEVCGILLLNESGELLTPHPSYRGADISKWEYGYPPSEGISGKAIRLGKPIRSGDVSREPEYLEINPGSRSELSVPIWVHERIIGVINVESMRRNAYDDGDERFLKTIAGGMGSALERTRLFEAEQRRSRELESLYQGTKSLAQSLERDVIANDLIAIVAESLPFDVASIHLINDHGDHLSPLATRHRDLPEVAYVEGFKDILSDRIPLGRGIIGWVAQHARPVRSGDATGDARYRAVLQGRCSEMCVPMISRDRVIGTINLESTDSDAYSERDENLLAALANSATVAFENARLYTETQRRVRELETINNISSSLRLAQSVGDMLPILLNETLNLLKTRHGSIWLFDQSNNILVQRIAKGAETDLKFTLLSPQEGIVGRTFTSGEKYISRELKVDPLLFEGNRQSMQPGLGCVCLPIRSTAGSVGVLMLLIESDRQITTDEMHLLTILAEIAGNAIHRAELFEQSQEQVRRVTALRDIDSAIASSTDLRVTLNILADHALRHLGVDAVDVVIYRSELQSLIYFCGTGFHTPSPSRPLVRIGEGLAGQVLMKGRVDHVIDLKNSREAQRDPMLLREGFVTYIGVPLIVKGQIKGVFEIFHRSPLSPNAEWMQFLQTLAGQAAIAIDTSQLFDNLQRSNQELTQAYDTTLEGWARALELRDRETEGHTRRVTDLTLRLARRLGINDDDLINIYRGVLLHDIGKMGVPDQILKKTGPLTELEWEEMRTHPQLAYDLLSPITYLRSSLDIPYCHHEHWDGSGYPRGLQGEQIPLSARIFSVVDIWDALLSDRPYRKAWPRQKVLEYLRQISGSMLDPRIAETFLMMVSDSTPEEE